MSTPLGQLLKAIRLKKNIPLELISKRTGLGLSTLNDIEDRPEEVPGKILSKVLQAAEVNNWEYGDFSALAYRYYGSGDMDMSKVYKDFQIEPDDSQIQVRRLGLKKKVLKDVEKEK